MSHEKSLPTFGFENQLTWVESHNALSSLLDCASFCAPQLSRIGLRWDKQAQQPWAEMEWPRSMRLHKQSAPLGSDRTMWGHHLQLCVSTWLPDQPELALFISRSMMDTLELAHMPTDWAPDFIGLAQSLLWDERYPNGIDRHSPEGLESAESSFFNAFDIAPEFTLRALRFGSKQSTLDACQILLSEIEAQAVAQSSCLATDPLLSAKSRLRL
jgi:hypothetical protein